MKKLTGLIMSYEAEIEEIERILALPNIDFIDEVKEKESEFRIISGCWAVSSLVILQQLRLSSAWGNSECELGPYYIRGEDGVLTREVGLWQKINQASQDDTIGQKE